MRQAMHEAEVRSRPFAIAALLAALVTATAIPAQAGSESRITDPGAPAAAPANSEPAKPARTAKPAPEAKQPEKRKHAQPERRTAKTSAPHARQEVQPAAEAAPAQRPVGISIGVGGMSIGF